MGINLGAFLGPLVTGWLALRVGWHAGFAAAGVGMVLGLVQLVVGKRGVTSGNVAAAAAVPAQEGAGRQQSSSSDVARIVAVCIFFVLPPSSGERTNRPVPR
jgi:proton-dependent oligopeptide transporter, POT family